MAKDSPKSQQDLQSIASNLQSQIENNSYKKSLAGLEGMSGIVSEISKSTKVLEKQIKIVGKSLERVIKKNLKIATDLTDEITKPFDKIQSLVAKLPGGGFLNKMIGLDDKGMSKIKSSIMTGITSSLAKGDGVAKAGLKGLKMGWTRMVSILGKGGLIAVGVAVIVAGFVALWKAAMSFDENISKAAQSLNLSKNATKELEHSFHNAGMSLENAVKAAETLNGISTMNLSTNVDLVKTTDRLTRQYKFSSEAATGLVKNSMLLGENSDDYVNNLARSSEQWIVGNKASFTSKQLMEDIGKISRTTLLTFRGNTKELVAAAGAARKLGLTLDKVRDIGESSLNIESSIAKEMEARVIFGKNIALDGLRAAAMSGEENKATAEIAKNFELVADQLEGNTLKQKSFAEMIGISREELTGMMEQRKLEAKFGATAAANLSKLSKEQQKQLLTSELTGDALQRQVDSMLEQQTMQDQLNNATSIFKEKFLGFLAKALTPLIDKFIVPFTEGLAKGGSLTELIGVHFAGLSKYVDYIRPQFELIWEVLKFAGLAIFRLVQGAGMLFNWISGIREQGGFLGAVFDYLLRPVDYLMNLFGGWVDIFKGLNDMLMGDFSSGWDKIGQGVRTLGQNLIDFLLAPLKLALSLVDSLVGVVGIELNSADALDNITDIGGDRAQFGVDTPKSTEVNDFTINAHPKDTVLMAGGTKLGEGAETELNKNNELLEKLIAAVSTPVNLQLGDGTLQKMSDRSNFMTAAGSGLGI
jgi:hypothetical protein